MRIHTVRYGLKDGFRLMIIDKPMWTTLVDHHWPAGPSKEPFATAWFHVTNWVFRRTHQSEAIVIEIPISQEEANVIAKDSGFDWNWVRNSDEPPPIKLGTSVRTAGPIHNETRGRIVAVREYLDGETVCDVELLNGIVERRRLDELIDTRLSFEREERDESSDS